jgi:hypothetical protein
VLHVANGETTAVLLARAGVPGEILGADDILMEGPVPHGLRDPSDWQARARWLAQRLGIPEVDYLDAREAIEARIRKEADEVVLWTEGDVFCQVNLLRLLAILPRGSRATVASARAGERLGLQEPARLAALFERREAVTPGRLDLARRAWDAYGNADPQPLARLVSEALDGWPAMRDALALHLERFPNVESGLGTISEELLTLAGDGPIAFDALVQALQGSPRTGGYGLGDAQVVRHVLDLRDAGLLEIIHDEPVPLALAREHARRWIVRTTGAGEAVLVGDAVAAFPMPRWLGGVELGPGRPAWRRDGARLVLRGTAPQA